jgi:hypothetical protein
MTRGLAVLVAALLAGCTASSGQLAADQAVVEAEWIELSLADGRLRAVSEPRLRPGSSAQWTAGSVLFRRIAAGPAPVGALPLPDDGEPEDGAALALPRDAWIAVLELTEAQWNRLRGLPGGGDLPAGGMTPDELQAVLATLPAGRLRVVIPDEGLWLRACTAGAAIPFAWGNGTAEAVAGRHAVYRGEGAEALHRGPRSVGGREANAHGLYDMHGNLWELVRMGDGSWAVRGGAWDSPLAQCRAANRVALGEVPAHPGIGVRLALVPP